VPKWHYLLPLACIFAILTRAEGASYDVQVCCGIFRVRLRHPQSWSGKISHRRQLSGSAESAGAASRLNNGKER
jgi:hypothetical protein